MTQVIDGKKISQEIKDELREKVVSLKNEGKEAALAVILVGNDPASTVYVGNKKKADRIRDAVIACSLNELTDDGTEYGEFIQATKDGFRELEEQENLQQLLAEIMPALTERQRGHIVAALNGYRQQEIIKEQRVRFQEYHKDRKVIRKVIRDAIPVFSRGGIKLWTNWKLLNSWRACGSTARA